MYQLEEHIFLIGFMGVGKSTIARILSKMLGVREYDTDRMIVAREGREISKIFEEDGERSAGGSEGLQAFDHCMRRGCCYAHGKCRKHETTGKNPFADGISGDNICTCEGQHEPSAAKGQDEC